MHRESGVIPGTVVELGGRAVHRVDQRGPTPAVVLLGGCGVPYYQWDPVLALLGPRRAVRLDRPGLVGTPWPGTLPSLAEEVETLAELVAGLDRPILVAHSMAGLHAEALVRTRPGSVAGLVLVDGSVERDPRPPGSGEGWLRVARIVRRAMRRPWVRPLGPAADRLLSWWQSRRLHLVGVFGPRTPWDARARRIFRSGDAVASVLAEQAAYAQQVWDLAELRRRHPFEPIPVRVLTAAHNGGSSWVAVQAWLAESLGAEQTVLPESRHLIMLDQPEAIAAAVAAVESRLLR